jgi:hypothetical protein
MDLEGLQLPRRVITQNHCLWRYRSSECGYVGAPVFNVNDEVISPNGLSAQAAAVINAWKLNEQRKAEYKNAVSVRNKALETQQNECNPNVRIESKYNREVPRSYTTGGNGLFFFRFAYWNNAFIFLNTFYRQGILRETTTSSGGRFQFKTNFYEIERWGGDPARCSAASAALSSADAVLATATSNYNASQAALAAALAALPAQDPLWNIDVCGKRVRSCQLHFPEQSIPFGGYPGANLSR